jgi:hypothetical protein
MPRRPQAHLAPDGSAIVHSSKPQPDATLVKALARAWRWQRMLDEGIYTSISEIGDAEKISKATLAGSSGWPRWCPISSSRSWRGGRTSRQY